MKHFELIGNRVETTIVKNRTARRKRAKRPRQQRLG
jgi:hypothetical protein